MSWPLGIRGMKQVGEKEMSLVSGNMDLCPFCLELSLGEGGRGVWRIRLSVLTKSPFQLQGETDGGGEGGGVGSAAGLIWSMLASRGKARLWVQKWTCCVDFRLKLT